MSTSPTLFHEAREIHQFDQAPLTCAFSTAIFMRDTCAPSATYGPQQLRYLTLFHTRSGSANAWANLQNDEKREYSHCSGTLGWMAPGIYLKECVDTTGAWILDYVFLAGDWADAASEFLLTHHNGVLIMPSSSTSLIKAFATFFDAGWKQEKNWRWKLVESGAQLLGAIAENIKDDKKDVSLVEHVKAMLETTPEMALSVPEVARTLNISPRQLDYRFQQECGVPVARWIREYRIHRASSLLRQGHSVAKVSQELGFANPYHFSRVFKSIVGVAPSHINKKVVHGLHFS